MFGGVNIKSNRRKTGFTIVEIMVVMAIMALMSTLGITAMVGINNNTIAEKAAESILSQLREAQNKSFSVANEPNNPNAYPFAWGVNISESGISSYYIDDNKSGMPAYAAHEVAYGDDNINYQITSIIVGKSGDEQAHESVFLNYSAPFSKYYLQSSADQVQPCVTVENTANCSVMPNLPHSIQFNNSIAKPLQVTIEFRGVKKYITVESNGEAVISG